MSIRVIVADDQEIVRTGLRMIHDVQPGIDFIGEAGDGQQAVALAGPTVDDPMAVVVITTFDLDEYVYAALRAGARGFLLKDAGPALLTQAIQAAANGDALVAPNITARLLEAFAEAGPSAPSVQPIQPLTDREEQILANVARGLTNSEIADQLYITLSTVKTHIASLMAKLGARNRVEIAIWAYETKPGAAPVQGQPAREMSRLGSPTESTVLNSEDRPGQLGPLHR